MGYEPSEVVDLLVAALLAPVMWVGLRALPLPGKRLFVAAYGAMVLAYVMTIAELDASFAHFELFNLIEHAALAAAGVLFALGAIRLSAASRRGELP